MSDINISAQLELAERQLEVEKQIAIIKAQQRSLDHDNYSKSFTKGMILGAGATLLGVGAAAYFLLGTEENYDDYDD